jgi:signal transduction histidine kinase
METSSRINTSVQEHARIAAVRRYGILDTPRDGAFDRVTELAARLFNVPISIVSIVDEDRIWFKSRHGIDVAQVGRDPGLCASAILQDGALVVADAAVDPSVLANPLVAGELGLRFYAGAPLRTWDGHSLGTMCVIDKKPREFSERDVATLEQLAAIVVHELELRLATRKVVESERQSRALEAARRGLEAAEHERTRWARELHDETLQSLGALHMLLVAWLANPNDADQTITDAADLVQNEIVTLRHLIKELRPAVLDQAGLEAALESLAWRLRIVDGLEVSFHLEMAHDGPALGAESESTLYRFVQEALANVAKHAAADSVEVTIRTNGRSIEASVRDDGVGFDAGLNSDGFGLLGMRERAMLAGGNLEVRTARGAGTTLRFVIPLDATEPGQDGQGSRSR